MTKLKGDRDGFAGRYSGEGRTWEIEKFYCGKGVGARWSVKGPFFGEHRMYDWTTIKQIVADWKDQGIEKAA